MISRTGEEEDKRGPEGRKAGKEERTQKCRFPQERMAPMELVESTVVLTMDSLGSGAAISEPPAALTGMWKAPGVFHRIVNKPVYFPASEAE